MASTLPHRSRSHHAPHLALLVQHPSAPVAFDRTAPSPLRLTLADDRPTPDSIRRAREAQQRQRSTFLSRLEDGDAMKERYLRMFAAEDEEYARRHVRSIQALADVISQHRFGCVADCLPTEHHATVMAAAKLVADIPEQD